MAQSRIEQILLYSLGREPSLPNCLSRVEELLVELIQEMKSAETVTSGTVKIGGRVDTLSDLPVSTEEGTLYFVGYPSDSDKAEYIMTSSGTWELLGYSQNSGVGEDVSGKSFTVSNTATIAEKCAEIFNNYTDNVATGKYSHAEGNWTHATGSNSHSEGFHTFASGSGSHVEGENSHANGTASHAEGQANNANGTASHAEGQNSYATGEYSHAEGYATHANGDYSHTEGLGTVTSYNYSHVGGKYNKDVDHAFIIGNGYMMYGHATRSNAFSIDWDGKIYVNNSNNGIDLNDLEARVSELENNTR